MSELDRTALDVLPLLIEAGGELHGLAAPQASRLSDRIGKLLYDVIELYGRKWTGGNMGELAEKLRAATKAFHAI